MTTQEKTTKVIEATVTKATVIESTAAVATLPIDAIREHWQGHRRVTRRVIEAFPEEAFETYSVGGMRPFAELAWEMINMAEPGIKGIVTGVWEHANESSRNKTETLEKWDKLTELIDRLWPEIPEGRLEQTEAAFGLYNQPIFNTLFYFIDNEIHHRGQGYVYLRSLGIEPPAFWDRR